MGLVTKRLVWGKRGFELGTDAKLEASLGWRAMMSMGLAGHMLEESAST